MIGHRNAGRVLTQEENVKEYLSSRREVLASLGTTERNGLGPQEVEARQANYGPNKLAEAEKDPVWKRLLSQMADPMIIMLLAAAAISAAIGVVQGSGDFADVVIILFVVVVNSVLGVVQESKAEEALEALQEMAAATSKVTPLKAPSAAFLRVHLLTR